MKQPLLFGRASPLLLVHHRRQSKTLATSSDHLQAAGQPPLFLALEGQLGHTSVDTHSTTQRMSCLRVRILAVAAANKRTAAVAESGEVFTWGCNKEGQLDYGTSVSASNYTPRMVEYLKGKTIKGVLAAKYHTVVVSAEGEVFT